MSLFIREHPLSIRNNNSLLRDSFFDDFENEFFNHPLMSFPSIYPYYYTHPVRTLENQISKALNSDVFKSIDFSPKINLSEDEKKYYIHADLPGMTKDQVKMELSDDRVLTISGERETVIDDSKDNENEKSDSKSDSKSDDNANENKEAKESEQKEDKSKENKSKENKQENKKNNNKKYSRIECSYGKFSRSFSIPENADINNINAKMENGVLEVTLNKIVPEKKEHKHTIQIQ